jgi:hypothetical protein
MYVCAVEWNAYHLYYVEVDMKYNHLQYLPRHLSTYIHLGIYTHPLTMRCKTKAMSRGECRQARQPHSLQYYHTCTVLDYYPYLPT